MFKYALRSLMFGLCVAALPAAAQVQNNQVQNKLVTPTPAQIEIARKVVEDSGLSRTFATIVLQTMSQINSTVTATRPELINDMRIVLTALQPELMKSTDKMITGSAAIYAALMSEQELKDADNFFTSPAGKKYVDAQPSILANVGPMMDAWSREISTSFMVRVREEMKKKGHDI